MSPTEIKNLSRLDDEDEDDDDDDEHISDSEETSLDQEEPCVNQSKSQNESLLSRESRY